MNHPSTDTAPTASNGGASLRSSVCSFQTTSNPPVPPQAAVLADTLSLDPVPLHVRQQRVRNGSKRKRDLAAVRMAEELLLLEAAVTSGAVSGESWAKVADALRDAVPDSTFRLWLEPLTPLAVADETLTLAAPDNICAWIRRRYAGLIEEALQQHSDYSKVQFVSAGGEG